MALVVDAVAEIVISNLLGSVTSLLKDKVDLILNAKDEIKKLLRKLERLQKALKEVDRKPFFSNERDKDLEGELKDAFYDAQDIIQEYLTIIELSKRDKGSMSSWNKVRKPWITLCSCFKEHVSASYQLGNEVRRINEKLDEIEKNIKTMDFVNTTPKESSGEGPMGGVRDNPRETTHHIGTVQPHLGRADDKEKVKELLFDGSIESSVLGKRGVSIVSIVGQGGIGKTTLAKMIFKETEEQFGKRRWWVCVSKKPNRTDLLQKILKVVCKGSERELEGVTSLSDLCTRLQSELSKSRFLLVLDDIWELSWWGGEVEDTLRGGAKESKILITSRYIEVSQGIGAKMHKLPEMTFEESWSLFLDVALKEENELASHNLKDIGERIVDKCGGLPLVVQTVGSLMRTKRMTEDAWNSVEKSGIWEWSMPAASSSSSQYGDILPGLMLSYDDLPASLKSCFVYCCIYPKDYQIERDLLAMQWVAHGLIEEKKGMDVEVTANQCIDDLINRCMIEETEEGDVKLHDTLHDLASYIGRKEYSHASPTEHTRHLSLLDIDDAEMPMHNVSLVANKLRTLFCASLPSEHFTNIKWLRVLSLEECEMDELPNSIECLSLLKYLNLSYSDMKRLPSSIDRLWNLQTLDLSYSKIEEVPEEIGKLCNLRYLGLEGTEELKFVAEGLGKLTNLRTLKRFLLCNDKEDRRGCNIKELKDLNNLTGKLSIEGLGGARKEINLGKAQLLKEKHLLTGLKFDFEEQHDDKVADASEQSCMLDALEPPHCLKSLKN
ncbi:disease resistance protein RGA2-like [Nymphaea colorata]|uniref:NB-ARC domain-containing protein n=1 Tax=Nymphaea colorata TaxID=210225 RepID=A0A5K0UYN2_9MAGN|nr:disease resistance protein RGA2-like [Nymphaea colorata]